jgi:hypothetical protein
MLAVSHQTKKINKMAKYADLHMCLVRRGLNMERVREQGVRRNQAGQVHR